MRLIAEEGDSLGVAVVVFLVGAQGVIRHCGFDGSLWRRKRHEIWRGQQMMGHTVGCWWWLLVLCQIMVGIVDAMRRSIAGSGQTHGIVVGCGGIPVDSTR